MSETIQTRRRDTEESTRSSHSSYDNSSEDSSYRSPDQLPLTSVPRYMGGESNPPLIPPSHDFSSLDFISNPSSMDVSLPVESTSESNQMQSRVEQPENPAVSQANAESHAEANAPEAVNNQPDANASEASNTQNSSPSGANGDNSLMSIPAASQTEEETTTNGTDSEQVETVTTGSQQRETQGKKTPLPEPIIPRTGNIVSPRIPSPPKESIKRSAEIRRRTGSPPEMHHAKIHQAVLSIVDAARQGQRQVVWRISMLANDSRLSLEQMADEILGFVGGCVRRVRSGVTQAKQKITTAVDAQLEHLLSNEILVGEQLTENKQNSQDRMHELLLQESDALNEAHTQLQAEFQPYLSSAQANIRAIPQNGEAYHITPPAGGNNTSSNTNNSGNEPNSSQLPPGPRADLKTVKKELDGQLITMHNRGAIGAYHATRITPVMQSQHDSERTRLQNSLNTQATSLGSFRGQFTNYALRLTTPLAKDFQQDSRDDDQSLQCRIEDDRHNLANSVGEHGATLMHKYEGVIAHLDNELEPKLVQGLQKAGHKAAHSFREQGRRSERMMINTSASLARAYPELVARVAQMITPDRFLNIDEFAPRLKSARESARSLPDQQYAAMAEQAAQSLAQAQRGQKKQIEALGETAEKSVQSVADVATATQFDFENFGFQVTGRMREGGLTTIANTANYADRMAEQMLETRGQADGALANLIRSFCVSLNGAIDNSGTFYFQSVDRFKKRQTDGSNSVFRRIQNEINGDLSSRSQKLNAELTKPDEGVTTGLVILNVVTLGATTAATAGYLIYSDADDDEVFAELGSLQWPGQPALASYFQNEARYGDLLARIDECLSESVARRARNLFSADAQTRWQGRRDAIQSSYGVFGLDSDARRSLLQGLSQSEREAAGPEELNSLSSEMRNSWLTWFSPNTDDRMNEGYLRGDYAAVLSARMEAGLRDARARGSDEIMQSVQSIESMAREELSRGASGQFLTPEQVQELTNKAMQDFASHRRGETQSASDIDVSTARQTFIQAATADIHVKRGDTVVQMPVDQMVQDYVQEVVTGGWQSEDALAARQTYEFSHAGRGLFGPSETDQTRFTRAFQDPELARTERELREHPERRDQIMPELERLRRRREERMRRVAHRLNPQLTDEQIDRAGGGTQYMAQQAAVLFSGEEYNTNQRPEEQRSHDQEDAQYAYELVSGGRASLTAGIRLATRGAGTNEDLLRMTYQGRSKAEIAEARSLWQDRYGENLDEMLGIRPRRYTPGMIAVSLLSPAAGMALYGGETSGDLAMEIERLSMGEPETDQDFIELAALSYNQQRRRGTGFLAGLTMSNTAEARSIDSNYNSMARELLAEAQHRRAQRANDPNMSGAEDIELPASPDDVFLPDGRVNPVIASLIFAPGPGARGRTTQPQFLGNRDRILTMSNEVELAGERYKAELDRQESLMLAGITVLAIAATVILMAFGVGFVLASVLVALGSGMLTMAVKSGMRGERYGWEEAATDAANTAIEVAAAGAGGALAGGLGSAGKLASAGSALATRFGPLGGVIAREAIVGAVSSAAQTAIQDDTYKDGPGMAFGRILLGGVKGAAISAVSAGVSESAGNRINRSLTGALEGVDPSFIARQGLSMGPTGRNMLKEGVSEALGGMAGEATGIYIELASGQYQGGLKDALNRIGQAGLKDMASATGRAGVSARNRGNLNSLMAEARANPHLTDSDLQALRVAAVAAGEPPDSINNIRNQIDIDRHALSQLPPEIQRHAASMDSQSLQSLVEMLQAGQLGKASDERHNLFMGISEKNPQLDTRSLLNDLENNSARIQQEAETPDTDQQIRLRNDITSQLPAPVRNALADIPVHGLENIPASEIAHVARMLAEGVMKPHQADLLVRMARQQNPEMDAVTFLRNLDSAVQSARMAQDAHTRIVAKQRDDVLQDVPGEGIGLFARMSSDDIGIIRDFLSQGRPVSPEQQESLFRNAQTIDPTLERSHFAKLLGETASNAVHRQQRNKMLARQDRQHQMSNVPEHLRGTLSVLPEASLIDLHLRQMEGTISPDDRVRLEQAALRENPDLDLDTFHRAIDEAVQQGAPIRPTDDESAQMRREMLAAVPAEQRAQLADVPILVMRSGDFEAFTRSASGNAVTLILHGEPVIVMREGANSRVLREEGIHALQSKDPRWAERLGALSEGDLQRWDELPLTQQMALYRNKVVIEIDAHDRMIEGLAEQLRRSGDPAEQAQLRSELELAQATLSNLQRRHAEVAAIGPMQRLQIEAGLLARPQWLDQPARLFSKGEPATGPPVQKSREELLEAMLEGITPKGSEARKHRKRIGEMDLDQLNRLASLDLSPQQMRTVLGSHDSAEGVAGMIDQLNKVAAVLPAEQRSLLLSGLADRRDFTQLTALLDATVRSAPDATSAAQLVGAVISLRGHHLDAAASINQLLSTASAEQAGDFARLMDSIGSEGRQSLLNLMGEMRSTFDGLKPDNNDSFAAIAGLIRIASSGDVHQRVDLFNRTHNLLSALAELPDSAARRDVVNHIVDGLISGKDPLAHALDIRAASRLLEEGKLSAHTLERFHTSLGESQSLSGGDAFQLHLRDKLNAWPDFDAKHHDFAEMLLKVVADLNEDGLATLSDSQRAALADLEPWLGHITSTDWFAARVKQSGNSSAEEARLLLSEVIQAGLRGRTDINNLDTLRHIMQEVRQKTVEAAGEPKLNEEVKQEMARLGLSEEAIAQREKDFDKVLAENRAAMGRETPEVHLENLVRQRIEYQRMIDAAEQLAEIRHPDDKAARDALIREMTSGLRQKVTETVGEIAATRAMSSDERFEGFHLHSGFEQGTGFDQVWVRYGPDGEISEIMVVEAKGPGATTQKTRTKGAQMSAEWVARTAAQMIMRGDSTGVGTMIIDALHNGHPPVAGVVIQAKDKTGAPGNITAATGADKNNFHYDVNDLNRHSVIKTTTTDLMHDIQSKVSSLDDAHYRLQYSQEEAHDLISHARKLKLSDNEIADLFIEGSRLSHPIEAKNLKVLMESVAAIIVDSSSTGLFRREANTGIYAELKVPMQKRFVLRAALEGGVGLEGLKVRIVRDPELLGKNIFGYTHPNGMIDLYPDAFTNLENLIKTLGHERTHVMQIEIFGHPNTHGDRMIEQLNLNEIAAHGIEDSFWQYYLQNRSGRLKRFE